MTMEDLAALMGKQIMTTPEPQQGRSQQLPTESANEDQQLTQLQPPGSSDVFNRTNPAEGDADNMATSNSWPVAGSAQPTDDWQNMSAHMALLNLLAGKVSHNDQLNMSPGTDLRYSPQ